MRCNCCKAEWPPERFHPTRPDTCKGCLADKQRAYRLKRPKEYWQHKDKKYALKKRYGLTLERYEEMVLIQGNRCAICRQLPEEGGTASRHGLLHVDHDHETGRVRDLLCNGCNRALGFINDDPAIARMLAAYLERHAVSANLSPP